jgi:hypothetical protein
MFGYRSDRPRATYNGAKRLRGYQDQRGVIAVDKCDESARRRVSSAPCQKPLSGGAAISSPGDARRSGGGGTSDLD